MKKYGTDKPDLRNPLIIQEITEIFKRDDVKFDIFKKLVKTGSVVRAIITKNTKNKPRSFFDNIDKYFVLLQTVMSLQQYHSLSQHL